MKFLYVLLCCLTGFYLGMIYGGLTLPEGSGLAGGAIVFFDGLIGAVIALVADIFSMSRLSKKVMKWLVFILAILLILPVSWAIIKKQSTQPDESPSPKREATDAINVLAYAPSAPVVKNSTEMGLGMAKPDFYNSKALYFYGPITDGKPVSEHTPYDSISFSIADHHNYFISYAPPWFAPSHLKMDYETLYLKLVSLGREWVQVEVNQYDGRTAWVAASDVEIKLWPKFLLSVNSIENMNAVKNPLRVKPLDQAGIFQKPEGQFLLIPVLVKSEWIQVVLRSETGTEAGRAWLRWKEGNKLLVGYSLFS